MFFVGVSEFKRAVETSKIFVHYVGLVMAGGVPQHWPKDLRHFVHGLFARCSSQVCLTCSGKVAFSDGLGEGAEESDLLWMVEAVEEWVVGVLDAMEE